LQHREIRRDQGNAATAFAGEDGDGAATLRRFILRVLLRKLIRPVNDR
jgi:hypothetical protein